MWSRLDMSVEVDAEGKRSFFFRKSVNPADSKKDEDAFFLIRKYCKARALLGASFGGYEKGGGGGEGDGGDEEKGLNGETFGPQGLVSGHAYSVLDACRSSQFDPSSSSSSSTPIHHHHGGLTWEARDDE